MEHNQVLIDWLNKKSGYDVLSPSGATNLALDIESATGKRIGRNTIKRFLGILPSEQSARISTLDIVAEYLGFESWRSLESSLNNSISDFQSNSAFIETSLLPLSQELVISWPPDRRIRIRHLGMGRYGIAEAENSKLLPGDEITLSQIAEGFPFIVKEVVRKGESLGNYTAAPTTGIRSIEIL